MKGRGDVGGKVDQIPPARSLLADRCQSLKYTGRSFPKTLDVRDEDRRRMIDNVSAAVFTVQFNARIQEAALRRAARKFRRRTRVVACNALAFGNEIDPRRPCPLAG